MTCIAALVDDKGKIWMGCDTLINTGDLGYSIDTKIVRKENIIMGMAGMSRDINILRFVLKVPRQDSKQNDYEYMVSKFASSIRGSLKEHGAVTIRQNQGESGNALALIGYRRNLYSMSGCFSIEKIENINFFAIGTGQSLALGSLYSTEKLNMTPRERITIALEAAAKFSRSVQEPFVIECHEG